MLRTNIPFSEQATIPGASEHRTDTSEAATVRRIQLANMDALATTLLESHATVDVGRGVREVRLENAQGHFILQQRASRDNPGSWLPGVWLHVARPRSESVVYNLNPWADTIPQWQNSALLNAPERVVSLCSRALLTMGSQALYNAVADRLGGRAPSVAPHAEGLVPGVAMKLAKVGRAAYFYAFSLSNSYSATQGVDTYIIEQHMTTARNKVVSVPQSAEQQLTMLLQTVGGGAELPMDNSERVDQAWIDHILSGISRIEQNPDPSWSVRPPLGDTMVMRCMLVESELDGLPSKGSMSIGIIKDGAIIKLEVIRDSGRAVYRYAAILDTAESIAELGAAGGWAKDLNMEGNAAAATIGAIIDTILGTVGTRLVRPVNRVVFRDSRLSGNGVARD